MVEGSVPVQKEATHVWASIEDVSNEQKQESPLSNNNTSGVNHSTSSIPTILIRSVVECEEEEKSSGLSQSSKSGLKPTAAPKCDVREKKSPLKMTVFFHYSPFPMASHLQNLKFPNLSLRREGRKHPTLLSNLRMETRIGCSTSQTDTHNKLSDEETKVESLLTTKNLKLGTKVNAKVYQIRAHGLVHDLGVGIRGMHRFEGKWQGQL